MADNATQKTGSTFHGTKDDFWYFDRLPPSARAALANADFDWSSGAVYGRWKRAERGYKTGPNVAERIADWDRRQLERERKRSKGRKKS